MALDKVKQGVIADDAVGSSQIAPDTVVAADIGANAITASELADNAVDTAAIASNAVTTAKITDANITTAKIADTNITAGKLHADITAGKVITTEIKSHIVPGVLYPSYNGAQDKQLNGISDIVASTTGPAGSTVTSSKYGTVQSDGRMYYYTDIKGSKPIKDPRVGGHFGSQRHDTTSLQKLEQETATHGEDVFSVDGREWMRAVNVSSTALITYYEAQGTYVQTSQNDFIEVVGYFIDANISTYTFNGNACRITVNGGSEVDASYGSASITTPLLSRYVDASSIVNLSVGATLGINTLKIRCHSSGFKVYNIELIAQDKFTDATCDYNNDPTITMDSTSRLVAGMTVTGTGIPAGATVSSVTNSTTFELSLATTGGSVTNGTLTFGTSSIDIPAQNVVSFGKKFTVSRAAHHYDPFNGFTNDTTLFSSVVDTATSLGLGTGTTYGAPWDKGGNDHIRPFNGGRVVKWVDSDGTIKTSVTMMPRNAQNIGNNADNGSAGTAQDEIATASATNTHTINFSDDVIDNSLSEVAHTFKAVEFGNGSANGSGSYKDFTVLSTSASNSDHSYVMDDGLTSFAGRVRGSYLGMYPDETGDSWYLTFIGTGVSVSGDTGTVVLAQNLPYGTHALKYTRASTTGESPWVLDGIEIRQAWGSGGTASEGHAGEFTFHQPKRPPIPEDCVVLADYMLMADHVNKTSHTNGATIGKGVRVLDGSRDIHHDCSSGSMLLNNASITDGYAFRNYMNSGSGTKLSKIPAFGTSFAIDALAAVRGKPQVAGSDVAHTDVSHHVHINSAVTLGNNLFGWQAESGQDGGFFRFEIATPIHTSSHYQAFETPFLNELVGGDRNMEQTNLVCSSDGKTWDQITRDTSYMGNMVLNTSRDGGDITSGKYIWDVWRGKSGTIAGSTGTIQLAYFNKDWAIGNDRVLCLRDGDYQFNFFIRCSSANQGLTTKVAINDSTIIQNDRYYGSTFQTSQEYNFTRKFRRGDHIWIQKVTGNLTGDDIQEHHFTINRV